MLADNEQHGDARVKLQIDLDTEVNTPVGQHVGENNTWNWNIFILWTEDLF